ncbi:hypothetical protein [Fischerella sp. PCC 9605]|uniref:hypothetical protein n=1 Tax=Fischerella sp. PCC 9605 TaxID=1173024 RepID=UPI00047C049E|nr:hypothetical protein [Fischerella sp. PCC 9605]
MEHLSSRIWEDLIGRSSGPLSFRLIMQPIMAGTFGILDGVKDARRGRPPYFWTLFTDPAQRRALLRDGWKSIAKIFILAIILDFLYQLIVFRRFYPVEALIVANVLAIVPYLLLRGPINRLMQRH